MTLVPREISIEPGSELDELLNDAEERPVVLERNGARFQLARVDDPARDDIWAGYDPERAMEALHEAAGGWRGIINAKQLKADIYVRRRTANRPQLRL